MKKVISFTVIGFVSLVLATAMLWAYVALFDVTGPLVIKSAKAITVSIEKLKKAHGSLTGNLK